MQEKQKKTINRKTTGMKSFFSNFTENIGNLANISLGIL